jgi:hypothetical protein
MNSSGMSTGFQNQCQIYKVARSLEIARAFVNLPELQIFGVFINY